MIHSRGNTSATIRLAWRFYILTIMEKNLFKTKLCALYQRGRCPRQSCSFAHGDTELRGFSGSAAANGSREYRGSDLRNKLDRRNSPQRRYSPGRNAKGQRVFHGQKQPSYERGYSPSRSPGRRSERKHGKKQHLDRQSDISGSVKISDSTDGAKDRSYDAKHILEEKLKQVQSDIEMLDDHKCQLQTYMEEKIQEADSLSSRHEELETQLRKEQELCKRITSKIKKFIKVHGRYSKAQEELKRSQARLQRFGDQLASDFSIHNANEEDSSVNIVSDGEPNHNNVISQRIELHNHASPSKKRAWISLGIGEEAKPGNSKEGLVATTRLEKPIRGNGTSIQSDHNYKEADEFNKIMVGSNGHRPLATEDKNKRRKNGPSVPFAEKVKGVESSHVLPSTSMAAHAVDEFIDVIEMEEKFEVVEAGDGFNTGAPEEKTMFLYLPPPPPIPPPKNAYKLFVGEDQNVDVTKIDGETRDVDATSEVEIL